MTKKIKLKYRLKSWLVTLGIASVFGLAALGVNAANSYQKASAYEIENNGNLEFDDSQYSLGILYDYCNTFIEESDTLYIDFTFTYSSQGSSSSLVGGLIYESSSNYTFGSDTYDFFSLSLNEDSVVIVDGDIQFTDFVSITFMPTNSNYYSLLNFALSYNAPQSSGNFLTALSDFAQLMVGGIIDLGTGIATGITSMASALFLDSGNLSVMGGIIAMFCGLALSVGITTKIYTWVTTLGN